MSDILQIEGLEPLPPQHASLAFGVGAAVPGTIYVLSVSGGVRFRPKEDRFVLFGRNRPEVHVCVGEDDRRVSRSQGRVARHGDHWWLRNTGRPPLQLPGTRMLFPEDDPFPLEPGYTPVFVSGAARRRHLMELYVTGDDGCLTRDEVGEPVGNMLNHDLIVELLHSRTLVPPDLRLLDED